jgi:polysaccharide pyruvyl transferase WcaK-like protein
MKDNTARIAILHHTGGGNLGDDAIIDVVISNIRRRQPGADIVVFSMNPDDTARRHGVTAFPLRRHRWSIGYKSAKDPEVASGGPHRVVGQVRNPLLRIPRSLLLELRFLAKSYRRLKTCERLVISGGGQLTERAGPWSFPYALFTWTLLAKTAGVRCLFLNIGAGPLNHPLSRFFAKRALLAAEYISFRDQQSQALAVSLGFHRRSYVFPDNVFSLVVEAPANDAPLQSPIVGIAPMPFPFCDLLTPPDDPQSIQDEFIEKLADFSSRVAALSYRLQLFGSDVGVDPKEIEHLRTVLGSRHAISLPAYESVSSVDELLSRIAAMDYVVTCRFHGVVFALLLNKPVLAISHHPKVAELMRALGLSRYCVDMQNFDSEILFEKFLSLVSESDNVRQRMSASLTGFRSQLATQFDDLFPPSARTAMARQVAPTGTEAVAVGQERQ